MAGEINNLFLSLVGVVGGVYLFATGDQVHGWMFLMLAAAIRNSSTRRDESARD